MFTKCVCVCVSVYGWYAHVLGFRSVVVRRINLHVFSASVRVCAMILAYAVTGSVLTLLLHFRNVRLEKQRISSKRLATRLELRVGVVSSRRLAFRLRWMLLESVCAQRAFVFSEDKEQQPPGSGLHTSGLGQYRVGFIFSTRVPVWYCSNLCSSV